MPASEACVAGHVAATTRACWRILVRATHRLSRRSRRRECVRRAGLPLHNAHSAQTPRSRAAQVRSLLPVAELCREVEARNRLRLLDKFLQLLVQEGSTDPEVHNAMGKILVDANSNPEHFLQSNPYYQPAVVGKYCEKRCAPSALPHPSGLDKRSTWPSCGPSSHPARRYLLFGPNPPPDSGASTSRYEITTSREDNDSFWLPSAFRLACCARPSLSARATHATADA